MLPSSGPISAQMLADDIEIQANKLSLNDTQIRELAEIPSGRISYSDFYDKTYYDHFAGIGPNHIGLLTYIPSRNKAIKNKNSVHDRLLVSTEQLPGFIPLQFEEIHDWFIGVIITTSDELNNIQINTTTKFIISSGTNTITFGLKYKPAVRDIISSNAGYEYNKEAGSFDSNMVILGFSFDPFFTADFKAIGAGVFNFRVKDLNLLSKYLNFRVITNNITVFEKQIKTPKRFPKYYYKSSLGKNINDTINSNNVSEKDKFFKVEYSNDYIQSNIKINSKYNLSEPEIAMIKTYNAPHSTFVGYY